MSFSSTIQKKKSIVFGQILDTFTEFSIAKSVLQSISTNATVLALSTSSNATIAKTYSALIANASSNYTIATNNLVSSVNLNTLYFLYLGIATFVLTVSTSSIS